METTDILKQSFPHFRDWLKYWCKIHRDIQHIDYSSRDQKFFYGNSSYMDLGELLRKNDGLNSAPCMIYDTDIHDAKTINKGVLSKSHTFYICVLGEEQMDGESVRDAKDRCEELALDLMSFFYASKQVGNPLLIGMDIEGGINSTTPFLNGWEAVSMRASQPLRVPCFDASKYSYSSGEPMNTTRNR